MAGFLYHPLHSFRLSHNSVLSCFSGSPGSPNASIASHS